MSDAPVEDVPPIESTVVETAVAAGTAAGHAAVAAETAAEAGDEAEAAAITARAAQETIEAVATGMGTALEEMRGLLTAHDLRLAALEDRAQAPAEPDAGAAEGEGAQEITPPETPPAPRHRYRRM